MSLFADHITNQDDIVLQRYRLQMDSNYRNTMVLVEKQAEGQTEFDWYWSRKVFIPLDLVWKHYVHEGSGDIVKLYGVQYRPTKSDFVEFAQTFSHPEIKKLIFKGSTYIDQSILHPIFDEFNDHWCTKMLRKQNKLKYERI